MFKLELGQTLNDDGELIPAYGFVFNGVFIADPYLSECGRFLVEPSVYGLTEVEAQSVVDANKGLAA